MPNETIAERACIFFLRQMLSKVFVDGLKVEVGFLEDTESENRAFAYKKEGGEYDYGIGIAIDDESTMDEIITAIAHESVHVAQIASGRIVHQREGTRVRITWEGGDYGYYDEIPYENMPWEIEAYALEGVLAGKHKRRYKSAYRESQGINL